MKEKNSLKKLLISENLEREHRKNDWKKLNIIAKE
jgi:hypothetical protein